MRFFAIRIKHALDVAVHHANPGMHQEIPAFRALIKMLPAVCHSSARLSAAS
jgi:hypothetical protein